MSDLIEKLRKLEGELREGCWDQDADTCAKGAAEIEALRAKTAVTMGVGTGDGKLFVHGDCESIKAAQEIVLRAERLAEALRMIAALKERESDELGDAVGIARDALDVGRERVTEPPQDPGGH